jgi:hypothetical protein
MMGALIVEGGGALTPLHQKIHSSALQSGRNRDGLSWSHPESDKVTVVVNEAAGPRFGKHVSTVIDDWQGQVVQETLSCRMLEETP